MAINLFYGISISAEEAKEIDNFDLFFLDRNYLKANFPNIKLLITEDPNFYGDEGGEKFYNFYHRECAWEAQIYPICIYPEVLREKEKVANDELNKLIKVIFVDHRRRSGTCSRPQSPASSGTGDKFISLIDRCPSCVPSWILRGEP